MRQSSNQLINQPANLYSLCICIYGLHLQFLEARLTNKKLLHYHISCMAYLELILFKTAAYLGWICHRFCWQVFEDVHLPEKPVLQRVLNDLNYFFAAVFTLEFCLKLVGLGMVAYFSSFWNCLDCFIVIVSNTRTSIYPTVLQVTLVFSVGLSQRNSHVSRYSQGNMSILIVEHLSKFANVRTKNSCCALFLKLYLELSMSFITVFVGRSFCHHLSSDSLLSRSLHIHPSSRSPTHSPAQSLIHSLTHPPFHTLATSLDHSVSHSLAHSLISPPTTHYSVIVSLAHSVWIVS